jgi:transketolase
MDTLLDVAILRTARKRLLKMHYESGVGHIGGNLSVLDVLMLLFCEYKTNRDQLILSKGHSAGALYIALWSQGLISDDDLKLFHKDKTCLPGHPPALRISQIPFSTGSLGHGLSLASGLALAKRLKSLNDHIYCVTSDGEWQEGSTWEAFMFACHHKLTNLTILIDHNRLQGFGATASIASMDPINEKLAGFDAEVIKVPGHDLPAIRVALNRSVLKPKLIILETTKGKGISFMEDKMEWHYLPLKEEQYLQAILEVDTF